MLTLLRPVPALLFSMSPGRIAHYDAIQHGSEQSQQISYIYE